MRTDSYRPLLPIAASPMKLVTPRSVNRSALSYRWITAPTFLVLCGATIGLLVVDSAHRPAALLAIVNIAVVTLISRRLLAVNPVAGLLPVFFLVPTCILSAVSSLYFAIFNPDFSIHFAGTRWYYLQDNVSLQVATLIHLTSFSLAWLLFEPPSRRSLPYDRFIEAARAVAAPSFLVFLACVVGVLMMRLFKIGAGTPVGYFVYGFFRYMDAAPMICGFAWHLLSWPMRWQVLGVLGINTLINTITNSRYYAFIPALFFGAGLMFLSQVSLRKKYKALIASVIVLAVVLVIGNASRRLGGGLWYGGVEELQKQYEQLANKSDKILNVRWGDEIFSRMFFTGGHQIITLMPTEYGYKEWRIPTYIGEVVTQGLLPRWLGKRLIEPHHEEKSSLISIGHNLTETHSVERSFMGAAWELGGVGPLVIISIAGGTFLLGLAWVLNQLFLKWPRFTVLAVVAVCDSAMWSINEGLPSMAHECIYSILVTGVIYQAVRFVGNTLYRDSYCRPALRVPPARVAMPC